MAEFQVTTTALQAKREELSSLNQSLKSSITNLEETEATLATMWDGEAKTAFHNAFTSDKAQMSNFVIAIEQYITALDTVIAGYNNAESQNVGTAVQRTYP